MNTEALAKAASKRLAESLNRSTGQHLAAFRRAVARVRLG